MFEMELLYLRRDWFCNPYVALIDIKWFSSAIPLEHGNWLTALLEEIGDPHRTKNKTIQLVQLSKLSMHEY